MINELVVRKVTDTDYCIGLSQVSLTAENIVYVWAVGPQTSETALAHIDLYRQLYQEINKPLNFIIDLNEAGKNSPEARKAWKDVAEDVITCKVALVGIHPVARVLAGFVMSITGAAKIQFFSTRDRAIRWLSE